MSCSSCGAAVPDGARFCPGCGQRTEPAGVLSAWLDAETVGELRVGARCLLRLRVVNESTTALRGVHLALTWSDRPLEALRAEALEPGADAVLALLLRPEVAGHGTVGGTARAVDASGTETLWGLQGVHLRVAGPAALQQSIHIDARSQRVGIFENIGGAGSGGLVGAARWEPLELRRLERAPSPAAADLAVGFRGTGVVAAAGAELLVALEGHTGVLVDLEDPALRSILGPGDRLSVTVLGTDDRGRPLLSTRPARAGSAPAPAPTATTEVGPGGLAAAIAAAAPGSTLVIRGPQEGPLAIDKPLTLDATEAVLHVPRGVGLRLSADVVVRGLVVRGTAAGGYAPDGIEIAGGRVVLEGCDIAVNSEGALTPGRGVAVTGPASVEIRGGRIHHCGVGVAVDVSWSGFPTTTARGARVHVRDVAFADNDRDAASAGEGRELHLVGCTLSP